MLRVSSRVPGPEGWQPHVNPGAPFPLPERAAVLDGVQAEPSGWPAASLDTISGRLLLAAIRNDAGIWSRRRSVEGCQSPGRVTRSTSWIGLRLEAPDDDLPPGLPALRRHLAER